MIIVITGPQGCGKGTQADLLEEEHGFRHISMGDVLRDEVAEGTEDGREASDYMKAGDLVPFELNNRILKKALDRYKGKTILLDGYPRSVRQAEHLLKIAKVKCVININISDEVALLRSCNRRICTTTKKIYIVDRITPEDEEECRKAGGEIIQRNDDKPDVMKERLRIYHSQTEPCLWFMKKNNIPVLEINGEKPVDAVARSIRTALKKRKIE
jgi:adenylate kinase